MNTLYVVVLILSSYSCAKKDAYQFVSYYSLTKLMNVRNEVRLHSHEVKYGDSGSGQQSVTGVINSEDVNSYWVVLPKKNSNLTRGKPIKCGSVIRLKHLQTNRLLRSHNYKSPLTQQQEVSAHATEEQSGAFDTWEVVCSGKEQFWVRSTPVMFRHRQSLKYLRITGSIYGHPISGQSEIAASTSSGDDARWICKEGIFFPEILPETPSSSTQNKATSDEL